MNLSLSDGYQNKLNELNELIVKRFSDLSDTVTPTFCIHTEGLQNDLSLDLYFNKKITLSAKVYTTGQSLTIELDGQTLTSLSSSPVTCQTFTAERGKHTLTLCPSGALTAKVLIKGASIIDNL